MHYWKYLITAIIAHLNHHLAQQNAYLIQENRILRSKLGRRVTVTQEERSRLLRFAEPLGESIRDIVSIVKPATFLRWIREMEGSGEPGQSRMGRPLTSQEVVDLVVRINDENAGWGHKKIHGELMKLGVKLSKTSVYNILKQQGKEPGPSRECQTWAEFLSQHMQTLWACDFLTTKVWTWAGPVTYYVLVYVHLGTRRIWLGGATPHPDQHWMLAQGRRFVDFLWETEDTCSYIVLDQDRKYCLRWKLMMKAYGITLKFTSRQAPKMNSYAESAIKTVKRECLNHFVICGQSHLEHLLEEYLEYYNHYRPHRGVGNVPIDPVNRGPTEPTREPLGEVGSVTYLGGLHHHYFRSAA